MASDLVFRVDDLVGHLDRKRVVFGSAPVSLRLGESKIEGPMQVNGMISGTIDGIQVTFTAEGEADLTCVRCLTGWVQTLEVGSLQHFSTVPDEDGYAIVGGAIDLTGPATDELALGIPAAPVCRPNCLGLCPNCGTDLNTEPCDGHGGDSDSPFAVLKDLFEP